MAYNAEYAVRIAKVKMSTRKKPDCLYITFGPKAHVKKKYNAVEISVFPGKLSFRFFTTEVKKFGSKSNTAISKKVRITDINSSTSRVAIYDEDFIKKLEGFEGEYQDMSTNPARNLKFTDDYICWVNLVNKESYTNMYKNSSTEYLHKKPEPPEADISSNDNIAVPIDETKPSFAEVIQKQTARVTDAIDKVFGIPEPVKLNPEDFPEKDPRKHVDELFKELTYQAHKCTDQIQNAMADIWDYQLRKVHVTYKECNRNIKLQQILLKYIALQDELEKISSEGDNDGTVQEQN
ncbi:MAG: hypothetical protein J5617_03850 [Bacilli bacterium]|nr:hypothetical protein [Bacilli bacterium]